MLFNPLFFKSPEVSELKPNDNKSFLARKTNYLFSEIIKVFQDKASGGSNEAVDNIKSGEPIKIEISGNESEKIKNVLENLTNAVSGTDKKPDEKNAELAGIQANLMQFLQNLLSSLPANDLKILNSPESASQSGNINKLITELTDKLNSTGSANLDITIGSENIKLNFEKVTSAEANLPGTKNLSNSDLTKLLSDASLPSKGSDKLFPGASGNEAVNADKSNTESNSIIKTSIECSGKPPVQNINTALIGNLKNVIDNNPLAGDIKEVVIKKESVNNAGVNDTGNSNKEVNTLAESISNSTTVKKTDDNPVKIETIGLKDDSLKELNNILNSQNQSNNFANADKSSNAQQILQTPVMKTVTQGQIMSEISKFIKLGDKNNITLKLTPESLGKIKIVIDSADKIVHARVEVENNSVKQIVSQNIDSLRTSLAQQGIQLATFNVALSGQDQKSNKSYTSKRKSGTQVSVSEVSGQEEVEIQKNMGYNTYEFLA